MIDLTPVINAIITLVAALVTAFVIPWIKCRTKAQDREELLAWAKIAVAAAQQLNPGQDGPTRKQYVLNFLKERGFAVDDRMVDTVIEAAVLELHQKLEK